MAEMISVPWTSGRMPNAGSENSGDHSLAGQELLERDDVGLEERERLTDEREHDADGDEDRHQGGQEQQQP